MSQELISRSPDLKRLRDEGYHIAVQGGFLVVRDIPYVDAGKQVKRGVLVSELTLRGDIAAAPKTHVMHFSGDYPCHKDGMPIAQIQNSTGRQNLTHDLVVDHRFSAKPSDGRYADYYVKVVTYVRILSGPAEALDPTISARVYPVITPEDERSPFHYIDTASSRAEINPITRKLELVRVGIVGLGGTGSYVLDLVAKTPVQKIELFDGDKLLQHNAFRSPGAPPRALLEEAPTKVHYFESIYSRMHRGIVPHDCYLDEHNLHLLDEVGFVFLCLDSGPAKKTIMAHLQRTQTPFVDVGMGVEVAGDSLLGTLRVTTSVAGHQAHVAKHVSFAGANGNAEYSTNIQIADLNALNAALAVVRWKKMFGFYKDLEQEYHSAYVTSGNAIINAEQG